MGKRIKRCFTAFYRGELMRKNIAGQKVGAQLVSSSDGTAFTGAVAVYITIDAATQAIGTVGSGAATHEGNGYYTYAPSQAETNGTLIAFTFIGTGAVPATVQLVVAEEAADTALSSLTSGPSTGGNWPNGSFGLIMYAFSQMLELVTGVWRWKATALSQAPSGTSTVTVLPAIGVAAGRGDRTSLVAYVAETITQTITVYQADGTTAYNLTGKTLTVIFENPKTGDDVAVVASGSITISGTDSNVVTFAYPAAATSAQRELTWTLRDAAAPKTVYLQGMLEVRAAATVD
jgi:hypothetical protein